MIRSLQVGGQLINQAGTFDIVRQAERLQRPVEATRTPTWQSSSQKSWFKKVGDDSRFPSGIAHWLLEIINLDNSHSSECLRRGLADVRMKLPFKDSLVAPRINA